MNHRYATASSPNAITPLTSAPLYAAAATEIWPDRTTAPATTSRQ
jgi:hypothetical protein